MTIQGLLDDIRLANKAYKMGAMSIRQVKMVCFDAEIMCKKLFVEEIKKIIPEYEPSK